ncbi:hypothetical protein J4449_02135 [Candidatus Woesearchaeota archaeon]|nr:hypothetical protein [Candidatus Woesearchaeota archaeon]
MANLEYKLGKIEIDMEKFRYFDILLQLVMLKLLKIIAWKMGEYWVEEAFMLIEKEI